MGYVKKYVVFLGIQTIIFGTTTGFLGIPTGYVLKYVGYLGIQTITIGKTTGFSRYLRDTFGIPRVTYRMPTG